MIMRLPVGCGRRVLLRGVFALALMGLAVPAMAESLVSAQQRALPAPPDASGTKSLEVLGNWLAFIAQDKIYLLGNDGASWRYCLRRTQACRPARHGGQRLADMATGGTAGVERIRCRMEAGRRSRRTSGCRRSSFENQGGRSGGALCRRTGPGRSALGWATPVTGTMAQWCNHAGWPGRAVVAGVPARAVLSLGRRPAGNGRSR